MVLSPLFYLILVSRPGHPGLKSIEIGPFLPRLRQNGREGLLRGLDLPHVPQLSPGVVVDRTTVVGVAPDHDTASAEGEGRGVGGNPGMTTEFEDPLKRGNSGFYVLLPIKCWNKLCKFSLKPILMRWNTTKWWYHNITIMYYCNSQEKHWQSKYRRYGTKNWCLQLELWENGRYISLYGQFRPYSKWLKLSACKRYYVASPFSEAWLDLTFITNP